MSHERGKVARVAGELGKVARVARVAGALIITNRPLRPRAGAGRWPPMAPVATDTLLTDTLLTGRDDGNEGGGGAALDDVP